MSDRDPVGPGQDDPEVVRLDEDFIRAATVKEPSARARMLAGARPHPAPEQEPWRSWPPPGARRGRRVVTALVAILAVVGGGLGVAVLYRPGAGAPANPVALAGTGVPAAGSASATAVPAMSVDPADPFAGSPAASFANGAAGIVLPAAAATGTFSAAEVADTLRLARAYLIAADLDRATVLGGSAAAVGALLDPRGARQALDAALRSPSATLNPLGWMTRFDPTETALVGSLIKVNGTTSYHATGTDELIVHMDYLVVYPVRRPGGGAPVRIVVRHILDLSVSRSAGTPGTLWLDGGSYGAAGADCDHANGYLHPSWPEDRTGDEGALSDPYDQSRTRATPCGQASRT
jgi:hypothetical protein